MQTSRRIGIGSRHDCVVAIVRLILVRHDLYRAFQLDHHGGHISHAFLPYFGDDNVKFLKGRSQILDWIGIQPAKHLKRPLTCVTSCRQSRS